MRVDERVERAGLLGKLYTTASGRSVVVGEGKTPRVVTCAGWPDMGA
jgi:hypothetical protein